MDEIASGIWQAIKLIGSLDPEVRQIALFSLQVSGLASAGGGDGGSPVRHMAGVQPVPGASGPYRL